MRIAVGYQSKSVNGVYRGLIPFRALQRRGHDVIDILQWKGEPAVSIDGLVDFDLVHIHRMILNDDPGYVDKLHEAGVAVSFDNDDDISATPPEVLLAVEAEVGAETVAYARHEFERTLKLVPSMDLVTTPSHAIADRFESLGAANVQVIENYVADELADITPKEHEGFVVGWHAGKEHRVDCERLGIDAMLTELLELHPHVRIVTFGVELDIDSDRYIHVESVQFDRLLREVSGFDLGIAPLADIPFNQARSSVKVREYAAAGVPWLASPVEPYLGFGKNEGGWLVEDDEWLPTLDRLISSSRELRRLRRRAGAWGQRELMSRRVHLWEQTFLDTVADVRALA